MNYRNGLLVIVIWISGLIAAPGAGTLFPAALTVELLENPAGIDRVDPRLSWRTEAVVAETRDLRQSAYQIIVASSQAVLATDNGDVWDSGKSKNSGNRFIHFTGQSLVSSRCYYWAVRVWDQDDQVSRWSAPARWTMGLLGKDDWQASWISAAAGDGAGKSAGGPGTRPLGNQAAPHFRKSFTLAGPVVRATLHVCGLGYHEVSLNGKKVGDHLLDPAFTRYDKRRLYVTHDVTAKITAGENVLGVILGNGWLNVDAKAAWDFDQAAWRADPMLRLQLVIESQDGQILTILSDGSWKSAEGPIRFNGLLTGEYYDARREIPGWDRPGFDDSSWKPVAVIDAPPGELTSQTMPPIRALETFPPTAFTRLDSGAVVYHFPQNLSGVARLKVHGPAGTAIRLVYGEKLSGDGSVDQTQIKRHTHSGEFQTDRYILKGDGEEIWQARFVYHGFQYVEVHGLPGAPTLDNLEAVAVHTDLASAGEFACSSELLNQIQHATRWSYLNNFHGYPTDCPHREKNGWTGDAHLAVETGLYNFQADTGYTKWMLDFQDEQRPSGELPAIIPTAGWGYAWGNGPAWDSAYILIPWATYQMRGDTELLARHYPNLKRYVDYLAGRAEHGIVGFGLGDWVPAKTETPAEVTSTAYFYRDAVVLAQIADVLGKPGDAEKYRSLAVMVAAAFQKKFFQAELNSYANGSQTALSCALYQGLVPADRKAAVAANLATSVRANGGHLDCGILGTKYLLHALTDNGHLDVAYGVATKTTQPSWGYWMKQGATTLWENWDGSDSLNHIMFGDISAWCYQNLAGIKPSKPGFETIRIEPRITEGLEWVTAHHDSPQGPIHVKWRRTGDRLQAEVGIPPNTTAEVILPTTDRSALTESGLPATNARGVHGMAVAEGRITVTVGSGTYRFESSFR